MWKLLIAFVVLAAATLFALKKAGGGLDMSGEKHGVETPPAASAPAASPAPASAAPAEPASAAAPASAASN